MTVKWQTFNQDKSQQSVQLATIARDAEYSKTFYSIDISPDGRLIAAGSRNGYIYIWDTSRLSPTKNNVEKDVSPRADGPLPKSSFSYSPTIINAHQQTVAQLKYLQNGDLLSLSWDGSLKLWPFSNNNAAAPANRTLLQFPRQLVSVATEPDEQNAYVTSEAGDILRVNLRVDRHPFGQFLLSSREPALFVDGTENRQIFTVQATGLTQYRLDTNTGQPTRLRQLPVSDVVALAWSTSTATLFAAQQQGVTVFRNVLISPSQGEPLACLLQPPAAASPPFASMMPAPCWRSPSSARTGESSPINCIASPHQPPLDSRAKKLKPRAASIFPCLGSDPTVKRSSP